MKLNLMTRAAVVATLGLASLPAMAHHATSTFYLDEEMQMTGDIVEVVWANPHGIIVLQDENGEYFVGEMAAIVGLASQGLGPDQLPVGLTITVDALPSRDGSNRIHINAIASEGEVIYGSPDI